MMSFKKSILLALSLLVVAANINAAAAATASSVTSYFVFTTYEDLIAHLDTVVTTNPDWLYQEIVNYGCNNTNAADFSHEDFKRFLSHIRQLRPLAETPPRTTPSAVVAANINAAAAAAASRVTNRFVFTTYEDLIAHLDTVVADHPAWLYQEIVDYGCGNTNAANFPHEDFKRFLSHIRQLRPRAETPPRTTPSAAALPAPTPAPAASPAPAAPVDAALPAVARPVAPAAQGPVPAPAHRTRTQKAGNTLTAGFMAAVRSTMNHKVTTGATLTTLAAAAVVGRLEYMFNAAPQEVKKTGRRAFYKAELNKTFTPRSAHADGYLTAGVYALIGLCATTAVLAIHETGLVSKSWNALELAQRGFTV